MKTAIIMSFVLISFVVFADPTDQLPNLQQARYNIFTAGQPSGMCYEQIASMGIKTVINVLPVQECVPGEESAVTANGMMYHNFPFDPSGLTKKSLEEFSLLLNRAERPLLIHCSTGNHVGGLWFAYRVIIENAPLPLALKEGRRIGMQPGMENTIFEWVTNPNNQAKIYLN